MNQKVLAFIASMGLVGTVILGGAIASAGENTQPVTMTSPVPVTPSLAVIEQQIQQIEHQQDEIFSQMNTIVALTHACTTVATNGTVNEKPAWEVKQAK